MFRPVILPAALALTATLAAAPAQAMGGAATISTAGLDLSTPAGRGELDKRIDKVANAMCADQYTTGSRIPAVSAGQCKAAVRAEALAKITKVDGASVAAKLAEKAQ